MKIIFPYDGHEHLGIGYLAAVARKAGREARLVPLSVGDYISGYRDLKDSEVLAARDALLAERPDVVAFSLSSPGAGSMIEVARAVHRKGVQTIAGGPHASAEPEILLETGAFDALVRREAEEVFDSALDATLGCAPSVPAWLDTPGRKATEPPPAPDIESLPWPAKDLFYSHNPYQARDYMIMASRGCPFRCVFCAGAHRPGGPRYRQRSADSLVAELTWAKRNFPIESVYFLDDVFTFDRVWLADFLSRYRKEVGLPFHAISHPLHLDVERARLLREAGCFALRVGVQTLTPHVRKRLRRPETSESVALAVTATRKAGIRVEVDHMVNLPGETLEDVRKAAAFYNDHRPDAIKVYWLTPLPGSAWFKQAQDEGLLSPELAKLMRQGRGYDLHSYLFKRGGQADSQWIGIHVLLSFLPLLPKPFVHFLIRIKADRFLRFSSFAFAVGVPRILHVLRGWDRVGEGHLRKLLMRLLPGKRKKGRRPIA
jgi:anaerobic magnesium-protoporphyrin IX monomethyl ester cyclase